MNVEISELIGKTITEINGMVEDGNFITFKTSDGCEYQMYHNQDCCESVTIDDILGDVDDLIGSPILGAEKCTNEGSLDKYGDTFTWTFYHFVTAKGYLNLKWFGESDGNYSESVDFCKVCNEEFN